jgi:exonuclease III
LTNLKRIAKPNYLVGLQHSAMRQSTFTILSETKMFYFYPQENLARRIHEVRFVDSFRHFNSEPHQYTGGVIVPEPEETIKVGASITI